MHKLLHGFTLFTRFLFYQLVLSFLAEKTELTIEDKYKRTMEEIECLKVELGKWKQKHIYIKIKIIIAWLKILI